MLGQGHIVEGLPGLARTRAVKALAANLDAGLSRIQLTPDLLPSDITGSEVWGVSTPMTGVIAPQGRPSKRLRRSSPGGRRLSRKVSVGAAPPRTICHAFFEGVASGPVPLSIPPPGPPGRPWAFRPAWRDPPLLLMAPTGRSTPVVSGFAARGAPSTQVRVGLGPLTFLASAPVASGRRSPRFARRARHLRPPGNIAKEARPLR
jgi:hypothetical protein